jgi:hypothetical protein
MAETSRSKVTKLYQSRGLVSTKGIENTAIYIAWNEGTAANPDMAGPLQFSALSRGAGRKVEMNPHCNVR